MTVHMHMCSRVYTKHEDDIVIVIVDGGCRTRTGGGVGWGGVEEDGSARAHSKFRRARRPRRLWNFVVMPAGIIYIGISDTGSTGLVRILSYAEIRCTIRFLPKCIDSLNYSKKKTLVLY